MCGLHVNAGSVNWGVLLVVYLFSEVVVGLTCRRATAHPNIVALHKVYHQTFNRPTGGIGHRLAVVMELAHGGNLLEHYNALVDLVPGTRVSENRVRYGSGHVTLGIFSSATSALATTTALTEQPPRKHQCDLLHVF